MWEPRRLTTLWAFTACYRESFAFTFCLCSLYIMCKQTTSRRQINSVQDDVQIVPIINNVIIYQSEFSHIYIIQGVPSIHHKVTFILGRFLVAQTCCYYFHTFISYFLIKSLVKTNSIQFKFVGYNLKVSHRRHILLQTVLHTSLGIYHYT
jgi:hypothetical protein